MELITGNTEAQRFTFPGGVIRAYRFDGLGGVFPADLTIPETQGLEFKWFHVELSVWNKSVANLAKLLIKALCTPLKLQLQDILSLAYNGSLCRYFDDKLIFCVSSSGPATWEFMLGLAARVTKFSVITVSHGKVPMLGIFQNERSLLSAVPKVVNTRYTMYTAEEIKVNGNLILDEAVLPLLAMNNLDKPVPKTVSALLLHIIDTHLDHVQDLVIRLETEVHFVERELNEDDSTLNKQLINGRRIHKMHWDLQHVLQIVAHGEQVFPNLKEKCAGIEWLKQSNIALEELIGRHRRLKDNLSFIENQVTAMQAALDSWRAEQINIKLYYLSLASLIFLPLSFITGVFGMNVGGVPWTGQKNPELKHGFRNVLLLSAAMMSFLLFCFRYWTTCRQIAARIVRAFLHRWWSLCGYLFG